MSRPIITLTTDFGQTDGYVGTMKGVILGICPTGTLVDITHEIQPQAVRQGAYLLSSAVPYFPPGTVHLAVVDPGVGSERRPIAVQTHQATYVAPDNGLLGLVLAREQLHLAVHLTQSSYHRPQVSATFHGRDLFAPAAAHLARGVDPRDMGDEIPIDELVPLPGNPPCREPDGRWRGEIQHVDRFGNIVSNLHRNDLYAAGTQSPAAGFRFRVKDLEISGLSRTFADVEPGAWVAYIGSSGYLEIAVREGNAAAQLGASPDDQVWAEGPALSQV
jgi:S-adenosylmethionine hydrolase